MIIDQTPSLDLRESPAAQSCAARDAGLLAVKRLSGTGADLVGGALARRPDENGLDVTGATWREEEAAALQADGLRTDAASCAGYIGLRGFYRVDPDSSHHCARRRVSALDGRNLYPDEDHISCTGVAFFVDQIADAVRGASAGAR